MTSHEFSHIEAALQALVTICSHPLCGQDNFQSLCAALDFRLAGLIAKLFPGSGAVASKGPLDVQVLQILASSVSQIKNITAVIKWNLKGPATATATATTTLSGFGHAQPHKSVISFNLRDPSVHCSFRFDGRYTRAQYFFKSGLGVVLQLGGETIGPLQLALAKERAGKDFAFNESDGWRLISIFAGDTAADGPDWPGYPTAKEAREVYNHAQRDAKRRAQRKAQIEADRKFIHGLELEAKQYQKRELERRVQQQQLRNSM